MIAYESVCTNVGDAGGAQQGKVVACSKSEIHLGQSANFQPRYQQQESRNQVHRILRMNESNLLAPQNSLVVF